MRLSIYDKLLAVREAERLVEAGQKSGIEKAVMARFPSYFASTKGFKSGMLGRWMTQCEQQRWKEVPWEKLSEKDRRLRELPDWIRIPMGMGGRGLERFKEGKQVPECVAKNLVAIVERVTCGGAESPLTGGNLDVKNLKKEAERLLKLYWDAKKEIDPDAEVPKLVVSERWIQRLCQKNGWTRRAPNTFEAYLPYEDQRMEKNRNALAYTRLSQDVRLDLCLNFDQVWKQSWSDPKRLLLKVASSEGLKGKRAQAVQEMMDLQERLRGGGEGDWKVVRRRVTGRDARANLVGNSRHSITIITSLWGNGECGPLTCVLPLGFISDDALADLKNRFSPECYFLSSGRSSHFMNAESVVLYYENVLAEAFNRRRTLLAERYGRSFETEWGLILCDSFTGHHSGGASDVQRCLAV